MRAVGAGVDPAHGQAGLGAQGGRRRPVPPGGAGLPRRGRAGRHPVPRPRRLPGLPGARGHRAPARPQGDRRGAGLEPAAGQALRRRGPHRRPDLHRDRRRQRRRRRFDFEALKPEGSTPRWPPSSSRSTAGGATSSSRSAGRWPRTWPPSWVPAGRPGAARVALVLGAGGTVGLSYHAGALRALELVGGLVPDAAELIVGTSAGSVVGSYLRSGWGTEDFWQLAMGTHPSLAGLQTRGDQRDAGRDVHAPLPQRSRAAAPVPGVGVRGRPQPAAHARPGRARLAPAGLPRGTVRHDRGPPPVCRRPPRHVARAPPVAVRGRHHQRPTCGARRARVAAGRPTPGGHGLVCDPRAVPADPHRRPDPRRRRRPFVDQPRRGRRRPVRPGRGRGPDGLRHRAGARAPGPARAAGARPAAGRRGCGGPPAGGHGAHDPAHGRRGARARRQPDALHRLGAPRGDGLRRDGPRPWRRRASGTPLVGLAA